jgi:hypothetical protein
LIGKQIYHNLSKLQYFVVLAKPIARLEFAALLDRIFLFIEIFLKENSCYVLHPFQIINRLNFPRYIAFIMYLDIKATYLEKVIPS